MHTTLVIFRRPGTSGSCGKSSQFPISERRINPYQVATLMPWNSQYLGTLSGLIASVENSNGGIWIPENGELLGVRSLAV